MIDNNEEEDEEEEDTKPSSSRTTPFFVVRATHISVTIDKTSTSLDAPRKHFRTEFWFRCVKFSWLARCGQLARQANWHFTRARARDTRSAHVAHAAPSPSGERSSLGMRCASPPAQQPTPVRNAHPIGGI